MNLCFIDIIHLCKKNAGIKHNRGESAAIGHFSVAIFFGQVLDNKESKNKYSSITV